MLKRKSKRVLSIVLAVAMIAGLFPIAAFADGGGETSVAATSLPPAGEDGVITLTEDTTITTLTLNSTGKTVIDLNGHTLTYNSKLAIKIGDGQTLSFIDSSDSGAERGGTLALTGVTGASAAINPQKGGTVNAENINISCTGSAFFPQGEKATVNINNCALTAEAYCVATNSGAQDNFGVKISIANSELTSKQACAVMLNIPGTLDMNNCTVTGSSQAVMVRAGEASISNCALSLDGKTTDEYNPNEDWKSGTQNIPIAALVVGSQTGSETAYAADAVCNVTNTTISASGKNANGAVYVSSNKDEQAGNFKSQLNISGENSAINGNVVVADGKSDKSNPSSVVISDNATVTGDITNNSASSFVAVLDNAKVSGTVTGDGVNNVFVENDDNTDSTVVALNVTTGYLYSDLATAVSKAEDGEIVQLLQNDIVDIAAGTGIGNGAINITKSITLDGNGKTITAGEGFKYNAKDERGEYHVINIANAANVTIKDLTIDGKNAPTTSPKTGARSGINIWSPGQRYGADG